MPIDVNVVQGGIGIEIRGYGYLTREQLLSSKRKVYAGNNLSKMRFQLVDFTEVTGSETEINDMKELSAIDIEASKNNPNICIAFAGPHDFVYGLGRMWQAMIERTPLKVKIFRTREEAQNWIDITLAQ